MDRSAAIAHYAHATNVMAVRQLLWPDEVHPFPQCRGCKISFTTYISVRQGLCSVNEPRFHIPFHIVYKYHVILPRLEGFEPV